MLTDPISDFSADFLSLIEANVIISHSGSGLQQQANGLSNVGSRLANGIARIVQHRCSVSVLRVDIPTCGDNCGDCFWNRRPYSVHQNRAPKLILIVWVRSTSQE